MKFSNKLSVSFLTISSILPCVACSSTPEPTVDAAGGAPGSSGGAGPATGGMSSGLGGSGGPPVGTGGAPGSGGVVDVSSGGSIGGMSATGGNGSGGSDPGSGGAASGGTDGSGGKTEGSGGAPTEAGCSSADILCVDFEDTPDGTKPSGAPWLADACTAPSYSAIVSSAEGINSSAGFITSNAASSSNTCTLVHELGDADDFWVTMWIKIGGTDPDMEHEVTFFELGEVLGDDPELRIGYRGDSSCGNMGQPYQGFELGATQSDSGEFTGCTGSKTNGGIPIAGEWYCIETHIDQSGGAVVADLFVDGVEQSYLVHSNAEDTIRGNFAVNYLKVGMQSYSGVFESLAIDDLSISSTRIPCPTK